MDRLPRTPHERASGCRPGTVLSGHRFRYGATDVLLLRAGVGKGVGRHGGRSTPSTREAAPSCLLGHRRIARAASGPGLGTWATGVVVSRDCVQHDLGRHRRLGDPPLGQGPPSPITAS